MWLDVAASYNDPFHVCTNFADTVISLGGIPYVIRADRGTENGNIEIMQTYLRSINRDTRSSLHATFLYGKSTANQRIEAWWSRAVANGPVAGPIIEPAIKKKKNFFYLFKIYFLAGLGRNNKRDRIFF